MELGSACSPELRLLIRSNACCDRASGTVGHGAVIPTENSWALGQQELGTRRVGDWTNGQGSWSVSVDSMLHPGMGIARGNLVKQRHNRPAAHHLAGSYDGVSERTCTVGAMRAPHESLQDGLSTPCCWKAFSCRVSERTVSETKTWSCGYDAPCAGDATTAPLLLSPAGCPWAEPCNWPLPLLADILMTGDRAGAQGVCCTPAQPHRSSGSCSTATRGPLQVRGISAAPSKATLHDMPRCA